MLSRTFRAITALLLLAVPCLTAAEESAVQSRFLRTALALPEQPELASRFASIALAELAESFIAEADLARNEAQEEGADGAKLRTWAWGVDQYSEQLLLVMEDVDLGFPVLLHNPFGQVVTVIVAGRSVSLAHPRAAQQPAYEQRVLASFCAGVNCRELVSNEEQRQPIPISAGQVNPQWDFRDGLQLCHYQGIVLQFQAGGQLSRWRSLCRQLLQEAQALAAELAWQQRHGVAIDWAGLQLRSTPQRPEHLVLLNQAGDSVLLTLPLLHSTPGLLPALLPWVRSRYGEAEVTPVSLDAREFGWGS